MVLLSKHRYNNTRKNEGSSKLKLSRFDNTVHLFIVKLFIYMIQIITLHIMGKHIFKTFIFKYIRRPKQRKLSIFRRLLTDTSDPGTVRPYPGAPPLFNVTGDWICEPSGLIYTSDHSNLTDSEPHNVTPTFLRHSHAE